MPLADEDDDSGWRHMDNKGIRIASFGITACIYDRRTGFLYTSHMKAVLATETLEHFLHFQLQPYMAFSIRPSHQPSRANLNTKAKTGRICTDCLAALPRPHPNPPPYTGAYYTDGRDKARPKVLSIAPSSSVFHCESHST